MSTGISVFPYSSTSSLHFCWTPKTSVSLINQNLCSTSLSVSSNHHILISSHGLYSLGIQRTKGNIAVCDSLQPGAPVPSGPAPPFGSCRKTWIAGVLMAVLLPFLKSKWGPLFKLKEEVETAIEAAEHVVDGVEKVAEEVEKVADVVAEQLPEGGRLKQLATGIEDIAREVAKDAHTAEDAIDKVEDAEKELESIIDPAINEATKILKDQNKP
ncbi:hypothetical protein Ancab_038378 [Ancistrocladus abbreviatus]